MKNVYKLLALDNRAKPTLKTHNNRTFSDPEPIRVQKKKEPISPVEEDDRSFASRSGSPEA